MATRTLTVLLAGDASGATKALEQSTGGFDALGKAAGLAAVAGVAAIGALAVKGVQNFAKLENQLSEVRTLLPDLSDEGFGKLRDDVIAFSDEMNIATDDAIPALYQAISAGVPRENALEFLEVATKAAVGGVTELETAVDGITTVMNSFGESAGDATAVSDQMFTAVRLGKTTFEELSSSLFNVAPLAASAGVGFDEITAGLARLTAQGTPTSVATTQLRAAIQALVAPSEGGAKVMEELGLSFDATTLAEEGLEGALNKLHAATGGNIEQLKAVIGSVEGVQAVLGLTGPNAEAFAGALDEVRNSTGATDTAFETMSNTLSFRWEKTMNRVNNLLTKFGIALLPLVEGALDSLLPSIEQGAAYLSEKMGPAIQDISNWVQTRAIPAFQMLAEWLQTHVPPAIQTVSDLIQTHAIPAFQRVAAFIHSDVIPAVQQLVGLFQDNVMPIIRDVGEVVGVLGEAFDHMVKGNFAEAAEWLDTGGPVGTALANFAMTLENLKPTFEAVSTFITGTLVPAFKDAAAFIVSDVIPAVQDIVEWFKVNLPPAMAAVSTFVTGTLVPAFKEVSAWITETGVPAVQDIVEWFKVNLPPAMEAVSAFVTGTLVPAFKEVSAWITETGVPALKEIVEWFEDKIPPAIDVLVVWLNTYLFPALESIKTFWVDTIQPAIETVITEVIAFITTNWSTIETILTVPVDQAIAAIEAAFEIVQSVIEGILLAIQGDWEGVWEKAEEVLDTFKEYVQTTMDNMLTITKNVMKLLGVDVDATFAGIITTLDNLKAGWDNKWGEIQRATDRLIAPIRNTVQDLTNAINSIVGAARSARNTANSILSGIRLPSISIPGLQHGGIVPATPGGRVIRVAEGGQDEAIVPLNQARGRGGGFGGGGNTYILQIDASGGDPERIAEVLFPAIQVLERDGAITPVSA